MGSIIVDAPVCSPAKVGLGPPIENVRKLKSKVYVNFESECSRLNVILWNYETPICTSHQKIIS